MFINMNNLCSFIFKTMPQVLWLLVKVSKRSPLLIRISRQLNIPWKDLFQMDKNIKKKKKKNIFLWKHCVLTLFCESNVGESSSTKCVIQIRLCIKPGIQGRGTECWECGGCGECYSGEGSGEHSGECPETFRGISQNIPGNVAKQVTILLVVIFI